MQTRARCQKNFILAEQQLQSVSVISHQFFVRCDSEFVGEKNVYGLIQSETAMKHSYTVMPTLNAAGRLMSPLYVNLQEVGGEFGPRVKLSMFQVSIASG